MSSTISPDDNKTGLYKIHSLKTQSELKNWTEFCSTCFSYKPNAPPPSFFLRKYNNDPQKEISLIYTILFQNSDIVSSTRVFLRTSGPNQQKVGGIGEVCTLPTHQKKGLAKKLLHKAIETMRQDVFDLDYSILHASPSFWEVYRKVGYRNISTNWTCFKLKNIQKQHSYSSHLHTRFQCSAKFNAEKNRWQEMKRLYDDFLLRNNCVGYIRRNEEYWNNHIFKEYEEQSCIVTLLESIAENNKLVGYIVMKYRDNQQTWQVMDFAIDEESISYSDALSILWNEAFSKHDDNGSETKNVNIKLPTFIFEKVEKEESGSSSGEVSMGSENVYHENDHGWMYLNLNKEKSNEELFSKLSSSPNAHIIWPIDSF